MIRSGAVDLDMVHTVLEETLSLMQHDNIVATVLCGNETLNCKSIQILQKNDDINEIIPLICCPSLKEGIKEYSELYLDDMLTCERQVFEILNLALTDISLGLIVLDPTAPIEMAQILLRILNSGRNKRQFFSSQILVLATMLKETETWKRNWLDRFRHDIIIYEPVFRAEVLFNTSDSSIEMGLVLTDDETFTKHLMHVISKIENKTGLVSDVRNIQAGLFKQQHDFEPSQFFLPHDYDQTSSLKQWNSQQPIGFQTIFQLEMKDPTSAATIKDAVARTKSCFRKRSYVC